MNWLLIHDPSSFSRYLTTNYSYYTTIQLLFRGSLYVFFEFSINFNKVPFFYKERNLNNGSGFQHGFLGASLGAVALYPWSSFFNLENHLNRTFYGNNFIIK